MLSIQELNVSFKKNGKDVRVLNDINYEVNMQKLIYVIGESGSGKTMLAQSIAGLLPPEATVSGRIWMGKTRLTQHLNDRSPFRGKTIGYIFQDYLGSFSPVRTIGWHYTEILNRMRVPYRRRARLLKSIFDQLGFSDHDKIKKSYPHQLSGGQLQRLQVGLVILQKPKIILADEITTALDAHIQNEVIKLAIEFSEDIDSTVIFITHDFRLVHTGDQNTQSEIIVMYGGRIMEILSDISAHHHPYTRLLLSCVPTRDRGNTLSVQALPADKNVSDQGCPFAPRCPNRIAVCEQAFPTASKKRSRFYCHNPLESVV